MLYAFDDFTLDLDALELRRGSRPVVLQRLPLDLLNYLVQRRDRVVTKDELLEHVWKGVAVGEGALTQAIAVVRRALGESRSQPCLIQTLRGRGYRFTGSVREIATHSGLPVGEGAARPDVGMAQTPFVGRHEVMRLLDRALEDALRGHGRLVLVSGLPGMGKTRICVELAASSLRRGMQVLSSVCADGTPPYWPWIQVLRQINVAGPEEDETTLNEIAGLLAKLAPQGTAEQPPSWRPFEEAAVRARFFERFNRLGVRILRKTAVMVILDDLHEADRASLELLHFLATRESGLPILFVGTYREGEVRLRAETGVLIDELSHVPGVVSHALPGMEREEVARLFQAVSGQYPAAEALDSLCRRTGGNPFFVKELARLPEQAGTSATGGRGVPLGVSDAVRRHLDMVSPRCRETLATASVIGFDFDAPLLAAAAGGRLALVLEDLDEAVVSGLVVRTRGAGVGYRFAHMLICEVLYEALPPTRRAALHGRIGDAIERLPGATDIFVAELAEHFYKAAVYEPERCVRYARRAALRAMYSFAFEEAVRHYQRALEVLPYADTNEKLRLQLLLGLGMAYARVGNFEQAQPILRQVMDLSRAQDEREMLAWATYGFCVLEHNDQPVPTVINVLQETLAVYDEPSALRVLLLAQLADALWFVPPIENARTRALEAVELGRSVGQPEALALALNRAHRICMGPASAIDDRFAFSAELAHLRPQIREPQTRVESHVPPLWDALFVSDRISFDREVEAISREAKEIGQPFAFWYANVYETARAHLAGHFDLAETLARRARSGKSPGGKPFAEHVFALQFLGLCMDRGCPAEILPLLEERVSSERDLGWMLHVTRCQVALGYTEGPRRYVTQLIREKLSKIPRNVSWVADLCCLADLCVSLKMPKEGAVISEELQPFASYQDVFGAGWIHQGSVALRLANLAVLQRQWDAACRYFEIAIDNDRKLGAVPSIARDQYDYASCLVAAGRSRSEARERFTEATETAAELGMRRLRESGEAKLRGVSRRIIPENLRSLGTP